MKLKTLATAVCIAASAATLPAMAAVQTFNISGFDETATNFTQALSLHLFDSHLGTLTGVSISYDTDVTGKVLLSNSKSVAKDVALSLSSTALWSLGSLALGATSQSLLSGTVTAAALSDDVEAGKQTKKLTITTNFASNEFALFSGTGTVASQLTLRANSTAKSPSGITADYSTVGTGLGGTINYTYTPAPVPEPETYGMLLLGLGVLGLAVQRKARSARV